MSKSKREIFKKNRAVVAAAVEDSWEKIASDVAQERDELKKQVENLKNNSSANDIVDIDPENCENWLYADRSEFELGDLNGLAEDIKANGQLQPAIVRKRSSTENLYEVIAGERRWRACKLAGVPLKAVIIDADDDKCIVIQTSENKNEALSPYSLSKAYQKMMETQGISQNKMAEILSIPKSSFGDLLAFSRVPNELWIEVSDMSKVSQTTAAFIAKMCEQNPSLLKTFKSISADIREGRSVRYLEKKIQKSALNKLQNRNRTYVYKNEDGKVLFRITDAGRVTLTEEVTSKYSIEVIQKKLAKALSQ